MSYTKYYWFGHVKRTIEQYPNGLSDGTVQSAIAKGAIEKAITETYKMTDGADRVKLVEMVYFKKVCTLDGASMKLHISYRTAVRWSHKFIYLVADKMGYM